MKHKIDWQQATEQTIDETIVNSQNEVELLYGKGFSSFHSLYALLKEEIEEYAESVSLGTPDPNELIDVAILARAGGQWIQNDLRKNRVGEEFYMELYISENFSRTKKAFSQKVSEGYALEELLLFNLNDKLNSFWNQIRKKDVYIETILEILILCRTGLFLGIKN